MVEAIIKEIYLQRHFLDEPVHTIYFGGGTPSLLRGNEISDILKQIHENFIVDEKAEITLEANPDDLSFSKLLELRAVGINRLSIGLQTFNDSSLTYLNRAHSSKESKACFELAKQAGFDNISLDLIYAIPSESHDNWKVDLEEILRLRPTHISSYCLTIENNTTFGNWLNKGKIKAVTEEFAARQFEILMDTLSACGYEQYEISNFCKPEYQSKHNTNYWKQEAYLGIGPSAHSFHGHTRQYNVSNNSRYIKAIEGGAVPFTLDKLTREDQINEYIMTSLRTCWGCSFEKISHSYDVDVRADNQPYIDKLLNENLAYIKQDALILTNHGKLLADKIASDLFYV